MKYEDIIPALAGKLGVDGVEIIDDACTLKIDDMLICLSKVADGEGILLGSTVGEPPPENPDAFGSLLLQANHQFAGVDGAMFSQDPESKKYLLERILPLDLIDADYLSIALAEFVDAVERWRKALADFRPALEKAHDDGEASDFHGDFIIV